MTNDKIVDVLNKLIETCKDGEYGFQSCAEHVKSSDLKTVFEKRAEDCRRGASDLQALVTRFGGKADTSSSASGTLHRGWVSVVGTLTGTDVMSIVQSQYEGVKRNHDQVRRLRDQVRAAS